MDRICRKTGGLAWPRENGSICLFDVFFPVLVKFGQFDDKYHYCYRTQCHKWDFWGPSMPFVLSVSGPNFREPHPKKHYVLEGTCSISTRKVHWGKKHQKTNRPNVTHVQRRAWGSKRAIVLVELARKMALDTRSLPNIVPPNRPDPCHSSNPGKSTLWNNAGQD